MKVREALRKRAADVMIWISYNMQMSEPRFQEIFEEMQRVLAGKKELSNADIDQINCLIELLKEQCRGAALSFPASVIAARNP